MDLSWINLALLLKHNLSSSPLVHQLFSRSLDCDCMNSNFSHPICALGSSVTGSCFVCLLFFFFFPGLVAFTLCVSRMLLSQRIQKIFWSFILLILYIYCMSEIMPTISSNFQLFKSSLYLFNYETSILYMGFSFLNIGLGNVPKEEAAVILIYTSLFSFVSEITGICYISSNS